MCRHVWTSPETAACRIGFGCRRSLMSASGCPAGRLLPVAGLGVLCSVQLLRVQVRDRSSFEEYCEPSVHRRPALARRPVAFRATGPRERLS